VHHLIQVSQSSRQTTLNSSYELTAAHSKSRLQYADNSSHSGTESSEILKVPENERRGLFVLVASENGDNGHNEGHDVEEQQAFGDFVEQFGSP
jgi:hypothetical protein